MTISLTVILLITSAFTAYLAIGGKTFSEGEESIFSRLTVRGWVATFCILITAICGVVLLFLNEQISAERDERQKKINELAMESRLPDAEGMRAKELLALEHNSDLISKSKDGAYDWVDDYLSNLSEKGRNFALAEKAKETLANELHLYWLPHVEVLRSGFRNRAEAIAKEFGGQYTETLTEHPVLVAYSRRKSPISVLNLPGGFSLTLSFSPGLVSDAERVPPALIIYDRTPSYSAHALSYSFSDQNALHITNGNGPFEQRFKPYRASIPINADNSYIEHLNQALNSVFEIWLGAALK